ncbi:hypothetical protein [Streptomyces gilvosporeus]|uniref:Uncharacterized protein n=1 Tax=Streptomyces gilvosporeus TaxID=553510 RepID=A0A1V0TSS5_9ACTN|nr:hypothetical protein [Streptomyces gilvosporeus]ARF55977.1 hypothetical protein B1H19_18900 [Streptomyces gilvosporeus]
MSVANLARARAIRSAAQQLAYGVALRESMSPREAARAAWYPGHRLGSVEAIEAHIRADRASRTPAPAALRAAA